jgi:hypothetical protein
MAAPFTRVLVPEPVHWSNWLRVAVLGLRAQRPVHDDLADRTFYAATNSCVTPTSPNIGRPRASATNA